MPDISHLWASDLALSPTGDIETADGPALGTQRVLRRLLTNPGAYLWHLSYGAGLAAYVGAPAAADTIRAAVLNQLFLDGAVASSPEPVIDVQPGTASKLYLSIRYVDADTALPQALSTVIAGV